jgi:hypothetical protein
MGVAGVDAGWYANHLQLATFAGCLMCLFSTKTAKIENFAGLTAFEGSSRDALRALRWGSWNSAVI